MTEPSDHRSELLAYATEVAGADSVETVYEAMADAAAAIFDFSSAVVETERDGVLSVRTWSGRRPSVTGIAADEGLAGQTFQTGEAEVVPDVEDDPRVEDAPEDSPRSVVTVPIGDVGIFQAGMDEPDSLDEDDLELAELLASHAFQAVQRIRSQRDVRDSEERFRTLFEQADDALVLYDTHHDEPATIEHANESAETIFGASEAELRERSLADLLAADDARLVPSEEDVTVETTLADADDDRILEVRVKPFDQRTGADAFAVVSDVTDQHHREQTLTGLHDATRRMLVGETPEEIASVIVEAAKELLGLPYVGVFFRSADRDALQPAAVSGTVGADEPPVLEAGKSLAWRVYEDGEPEKFDNVPDHPDVHNPSTLIEEEIIHPLGEYGVVLVGASERETLNRTDCDLLRVLAANGEAALDRADRVQMLHDREAELRRERNRLAALFENIPSPTASFVVEDGEPIIQSINPAFERVFGYGEAELADEKIDDYIVPPESRTEAEVYNQKLKEGQNVNAEVRRIAADGLRDFLLDVVPFRLDKPNVHGYAMYTDITDRKERERELKRQNDRLEEFAGIVSHDLRNPLNVARGYVELAEETGDDEHFERADTALERMHDIIESVLTLARQGRSLDETVEVSLSDAAEQAWRNVETDGATLAVSDDATLLADPSRFGSLLENLFGNAVEHGGPGVTVTVGSNGDEFFVEDDGPGIPPEHRDAVFRSGETHSEDGTGFGLAIVKGIAEAHGWSVSVTEGADGGARFEFAGTDSTST
ncbi:PAS domain S-box protein [Halobacterium wangiae]|uniref:PAS domain S-box protein n=1 Tax=Halobacterium wangiae TaxID=2902623 RepID=UPI001E472B85|nr:PAS domain S-box protein [Halobacterium wangiae]